VFFFGFVVCAYVFFIQQVAWEYSPLLCGGKMSSVCFDYEDIAFAGVSPEILILPVLGES